MCKIGVLALQGDYREHIKALHECGAKGYGIKMPQQIKSMQGLIIPGGESTTIGKLIEKYDFRDTLDHFFRSGKPIMGTCAGLIMLAKEVIEANLCLGYIDLTVQRNAYGRQIDSFEQNISINFNHRSIMDFRAVFIRAPKIISTGKNVQIMGMLDGTAVLVREKNILACSFHPELGSNLSVHNYFIDMVKNIKREN